MQCMKLVGVREVDFYPYGGVVGETWDADPNWDALIRTGRRVAERYSELVAPEARLARSAIRLGRLPDQSGQEQGPEAQVTITGDRDAEGLIFAGVLLPRGAASLSETERALFALDLLHQTCLFLADRADQPAAPYERARDTLLAEGLDPVWHSAWKASPDRKHRARLGQRICDDGWADVWIEVAQKGSNEPLGRGAIVRSSGSLRAFGRLVKTLRWHDDGNVDAMGTDVLGRVIATPNATLSDLNSRLPQDGSPLSRGSVGSVEIRVQTREDERSTRPVTVSSGGINAMPWLASSSLQAAWSRFGDCVHLLAPWWEESGFADLHISLSVQDWPVKSTTMAGEGSLEVFLCRDSHDLSADGPAIVLDAVQEAITRAARRAKIAPIEIPEEMRRAILDEQSS